MGSKICMNASCRTTSTHEWKNGWPLRSGGYIQLCYTCGIAYENSVFCDTFHEEEPGWRECLMCKKRLHCGCIASKFLFEILEYGGVGCTSCAKTSQFQLIQTGELSNGLGSLTKNNAGNLDSTLLENRVGGSTVNEGKLAQLCRLMEAQTDGAENDAGLGQFRNEEAITGFSNATQSSAGTSNFVTPDSSRSILDMRDMNGLLAQPSLCMALGASLGSSSFAPYSCGIAEGREQVKTSPYQQGQRSRPILPKLSKPSFAGSSETNKAGIPELRIARPPAEGRGKSQLLPRYWPRITDQELQQLSGDLNSNIVPLFEKVLSASDAGRIGRLVLPKACAEAYFPPISQSEGLPLRVQDVKGREWSFQFRFWPNNNSRMYVLEGVTPCIQSMQLQAGDTITFSRIDPGGKLVMGFRKATSHTFEEGQTSSTLPNCAASMETSFSADGGNIWNKSENYGSMVNGDAMQQLTPEKKRARNIGPKNKRLLMHSDDALELRLTWEEAQDLLRPPPGVKPTIVNIEGHEFEEYDEPPVFGKKTIFADRPSGGQEQWAQCDDCYKWRKLPVDALLPPRWTCSENVWDSSRCTCSAPEEMSQKDLDDLFRVSRDFKKRRIVERHNPNPSPECEPSGLDALASAAVLGDAIGDSSEPSVGATTTKHPRHRPGCTCIVCIQPPSGKGRHKPTCTCNVCMTVKRRFKTLMLRKKRRQSEREAESSRKDDESEIVGATNLAVLHIDDSENDGNLPRTQREVAETTNAGQIDLNCDPNRDDMQHDMAGLDMMNPFHRYMKQSGLANLICERQANIASCSHSQTNGESSRRMSDETFFGSFGWNMKNGGDCE
ncbi:B3 domain-containing transcription repressor VAL1 [Euphorbia lathyris]|uniref:B3 domain-containing transcription repressor VAL1 n=1 Tax=Euphorbia lathyris TaxID=212925 RepID=UPI0033140F29